jgi:hypothetical protein
VTPTQQDSRIGPDNIGGAAHRAARGSIALADQVLHGAEAVTENAPLLGDEVNRVQRLKALGNGVVPAVAHIFALAVNDQLERRHVGIDG